MAKRTSGPIGQTASSMGGMHMNQWENSEKYNKSIDMNLILGWDLGMGICVGFVGFCSEIL